MKFKITAVCAALSSAFAFAANLNPVTQPPERTFYIAGSAAQASALATIVPVDLFDTSTYSVVNITQSGGQNATGWYGMSKAALTGGTSQRLFVVYNRNNGSTAGVTQLISTASPPTETEADIVTIGNTGCSVVASLSSTCTNHGSTEVDMALSDVNAIELTIGAVPQNSGDLRLSQLDTSYNSTGLQGYGLAVNPALYAALQNAQGLTGCAGNTSAACQPSIRQTEYASLITYEGSIKDAAGLLRQPTNTTQLTLARFSDSAGTQAASNIFFTDNPCGSLGYLGAATALGQYDSSPPQLTILEKSASSDVMAALTGTNTAGYAIGVLSLVNVPSAAATSWQYVKLNGISPNFNANGTADPYQRNAIASGSYPFALEMRAMYRSAAPVITKNLFNAVIAGLRDSNRHNLVGISYLDGTASAYTVGGKISAVTRGGNNCGPLIIF